MTTSQPLHERVADFPRRYCAVCNSMVTSRLNPGPNGRPNASCPKCGSLERHRFFAVLIAFLAPVLGELGTVLEVAPSPQTTPLLQGLRSDRFVRLDLGADDRAVDVLASLTELPLADDSVDLLMCSNVLEHIPDDRAAMSEIARVLSTTGLALVQVPYRADSLTDEDPGAPAAERTSRFGQADHVRWYGTDFEDRLAAAGLSLERVSPRSMLGPAACVWLALAPDEVFWLVRKRIDATVPPLQSPDPTNLTRTMDAMLQTIVRQRGRLEAVRRERDRLRREVRFTPRNLARRVRGKIQGIRRVRA